MGNYCCDKEEKYSKVIQRKLSNTTISTTVSQFNSVGSMKKNSGKLLKFLQDANLGVFSSPILGIEVVSELGKGGQSKIFEIVLLHNIECHSIDERDKLFEKKIAVKRTNLERQKSNMGSFELSRKLMAENRCPFIMSGIFSFSCEKYMYSGMNVAEGGDLASFLEKWRGKGDAFRSLGEEGIKMVFAGVILGLEYLHNNGLIYCDLKIDNVLIAQNGYPLLADFELVSNSEQIRREEFQGTITSMGPEIHTEGVIDKGIDLWALGVLLYMITYNEAPFSKQEISMPSFVNLCLEKEGKNFLSWKKVSVSLNDLINSLLKVNPKERLGYDSISSLKSHEFFKFFNWEKYEKMELPNPLAEIITKYPLKVNSSRRKTTDFKGKTHELEAVLQRKNTN